MTQIFTKKTVCSIFTLCLSVMSFESAQAAYFIRPFLSVNGGGLIDGLDQDGATQGSQNFGTDFKSEVDLSDGTIKAFVNRPGANQSGQSGGSFGERVTFNNAIGTTVDFSFDYEGEIDISELLPGPLPTGLSISVFANLFVYDANAGATFDNFTSLGGALISQSVFDNSFGTPSGGTPTEDFFSVGDTLSGSFEVGAQNQFDVFAALSVAAATNLNDVIITMDFFNTGTFGIDTAPGVTYTSASGVFLDATGTTVIPVPAALPLFGTGLSIMSFIGWRRKRKVAGAT